MPRVLVALTGASGAAYGVETVRRLHAEGCETWVIVSDAARRVLSIETGLGGDPAAWLPPAKDRRGSKDPSRLRLFDNGDLEAAPASGSSAPDAMLVVPCSMGSAGRILGGLSGCLVERAADVMLKERRPLILVPRETPLSTLHLRHLAALSELGARIVPAMPGFYFQPTRVEELVEFVVDRALQAAGLGLPLRHPWRGAPKGAR